MTAPLDVLIVGAAITGIGMACHLQVQRPGAQVLILEREPTFGGTWLTNRYPGARSDSDLYTYGYRFKPWSGKSYATRQEILDYLGEVIAEHGLEPSIRYGLEVVSASWSSAQALWAVTARRTDTGATQTYTARFLAMCQGYYHHRKGHLPDWPGRERYRKPLIHTQSWPDDLDVGGKSVIVIGSGATMATVVPALAATSGPITVLQRSPSFYYTMTGSKPLIEELKALAIDPAWIYEIARRKSVADEAAFIARTFSEPDTVRDELIAAVRDVLGPDYDIATHFTPRYRPWQQRICYVPDADFLQTIRDGKTRMVTGEIDRYTEDAIVLASGEVLKADLVVAATGFDLCVLGGAAFSNDGVPIDFADTVAYRGMMFSGVPNLIWTFGYLRASWTLRVDMNADFLCRLLAHMEARGHRSATPRLLPQEEAMPRLPWIDPASFNAGYIMRSLHLMPRRLDRPEWQHHHDYWAEKDAIPAIDLEDGRLAFA